MKMINNLNVAETFQVNDIPTKIIKINKDIFANSLQTISITVLLMVNFPMKLKHADVIPVHKKNEKCNDIADQ